LPELQFPSPIFRTYDRLVDASEFKPQPDNAQWVAPGQAAWRLWGRDSRERLAQGRSSLKAERISSWKDAAPGSRLSAPAGRSGWNPGIRFACGRTENCWLRSTVLSNPIQLCSESRQLL